MPTPMTSKQWARFVLPIVRKEWYQRMTSIISPAAQFFGADSSTASVEYSQGIGDFGLVDEYGSDVAEGAPGAIHYDSFDPLYETTFTHKEYVKGVEIRRKLWDDDQKGNIRRRGRNLGTSFGTTVATYQSSVFNSAFATTDQVFGVGFATVGADAVALCSSSHPNKPSDTTTTFDNAGSTALSYDAVKDTIQAGKRFDADSGSPLPSIFNTLYVPIELEATAYEITNAINKPGGANNDANFVGSQGLQTVVDPYLSDVNNWFMIDSTMATDHLLWFWRVRPELDLDPTSNYNLVARYRGYMRYSYGWDDWRWVYGHEVA